MGYASTGLDQASIDTAARIFAEIADHYDLTIREGRVAGHGSGRVLAEVMQAYEQESGNPLPTPHYRSRNMSDRIEMARIAAKRVQDMIRDEPGYPAAVVTIKTLVFADEAWTWFKQNEYVFPDGRVLSFSQRGVTAIYPNGYQRNRIEAEQDLAPEESMADMGMPQVEAYDPDTQTYPDNWTEPLHVRAAAVLSNGSVDRDRALLAIEIAVKTGDAELAARVL